MVWKHCLNDKMEQLFDAKMVTLNLFNFTNYPYTSGFARFSYYPWYFGRLFRIFFPILILKLYNFVYICVFMYACAAEASTLFRIFYDGGLALHFPYPYPKTDNQTHTHHPHTKTCRHSPPSGEDFFGNQT